MSRSSSQIDGEQKWRQNGAMQYTERTVKSIVSTARALKRRRILVYALKSNKAIFTLPGMSGGLKRIADQYQCRLQR